MSQALEKRRQRDRYEELEPDEYVLVSNYGSRVRRAREKKGLGHANLAIKISEKKSILTSVEAGNMKPNEKLIKKLENALGIELLEKVEVQSDTSSNQTNKALTMGDLLKQAMDKK